MRNLSVPVALFIYNRPDLTKKVFRSIAKARPEVLLIVADGPGHSNDIRRCEEARTIVDRVDWQCRVLTNFSDENLGCKVRVASGIDWVFTQVEEAIILEDDCLPHPSFYRFCEVLLDQYRNDDLIMHISGTNLSPHHFGECSYGYSRLFPIWGWATWSRAWQYYQIDMEHWPSLRMSNKLDYFGSTKKFVIDSFDRVYSGNVDTWDTQWAFSCLFNNGLSIIPHTNLVRNNGFRKDATHTTASHWIGTLPVRGLDFPLTAPQEKAPDPEFDEYYLGLLSGEIPHVPSLRSRIRQATFRRIRRGLEILSMFSKQV